MSEVIVRFHEHEQIADDLLKFAVIMARHNNKWIYCRHKERATYEIPGGHKEIDEDIDHAAERELMEETGATRFVLSPICVYSVTAGNGEKSYGKLYFADISGIEALSPESEIGEIRYFDALPDSLTYPLIQPFLYEKSQIWLSRQSAKDGDNMQIKMIVTDLDDTLLRTDKTISEHTISVLNNCQEKGIRIVFATSRSTQAASRFLDIFSPDVFIGYGGALAYAGDKVIHRFDIPADLSYQLINECLQEPEIKSILATNELVSYANRLDTLDSESSHYQQADFTVKNNLSYLKISVVSANPNLIERIAAKYPMCDMLRYTGEDLYRFANRKAVKWNAVKAVAEYYSVDTKVIVAFGDDINDVEMVENCGIGIAMENAIDKVKAAADHICDTNDNDGVAKWLEDNVL